MRDLVQCSEVYSENLVSIQLLKIFFIKFGFLFCLVVFVWLVDFVVGKIVFTGLRMSGSALADWAMLPALMYTALFCSFGDMVSSCVPETSVSLQAGLRLGSNPLTSASWMLGYSMSSHASFLVYFKNRTLMAVRLGLWLRVLADKPEDLSSIPSTWWKEKTYLP